jgi:hypothetical protein
MHLCPQIVFLSIKYFFHELLPRLVEKIKQLYVLLALAKCQYITTSFDLWMSKVGSIFRCWLVVEAYYPWPFLNQQMLVDKPWPKNC